MGRNNKKNEDKQPKTNEFRQCSDSSPDWFKM